MEKTKVHADEIKRSVFANRYADGSIDWKAPQTVDLTKHIMTATPFHTCDYCGSMHPEDVVSAIKAGATISFADFKYGWPHKAYLDNVPNQFAGVPEYRVSASNPPEHEIDAGEWEQVATGRFSEVTGKPAYTWYKKPEPAREKTHGKFYTQHLQDCTEEQRDIIETALGVRFKFDNGGVNWKPIKPQYENPDAE